MLISRLLAGFKRISPSSRSGDSEGKFERIFHASTDWIVITRVSDRVIVEANQGMETIAGYPPSEVLGHSMAELNVWVHPEQRIKLMNELLRTGAVRNAVVQFRHRDGSARDCILNATLVALHGCKHSHVLWIARDVTEQNAVYKQFRAAFQLTPDAMLMARVSDGCFVEVNTAFEEITGWHRNQAIGKTFDTLDIWLDTQQRAEIFHLIQTQGAAHDHHMLLKTRNGELRDVMLHAAGFENGDESYMFFVLRDVTDARLAANALQKSEARFSRMFDLSPLPMGYLSDADEFSSTQWNQAWFKAFGFDPSASQGQSGLALNIWVNQRERSDWLERSVRGEAIDDLELQLRRADGELRWISMSSRSFVEPTRTLVLFTFFDTTERRHHQEEILALNTQLEARVARRTADLQDTNAELSQALETLKMAKDQLVQSEKLAALGSLVAGVAHELNTPVGNGLTTASSLDYRVQEFTALFDNGMKRSDLRNFLDSTRQAADILIRNLSRAGALVESFKQIAVDQTSSQRRQFFLSTAVSEILLTLQPSIRQSACVVSADVADGLQLDSYPGPLGQVLTNLINNAIVHGFDSGRSAGNIKIHAEAMDENHIVLLVCDSGRGIQAADIGRVFEPFFTTRLGQGGSGLGLHIVHNIVTGLLGGHIDASSRAGEGATFSLRLPMIAPAQITRE
ncbi:PAS domain S-box protein [Rhodoferax sp.]|uniref:PAS domain S-box protein n=1 Tax=Rhodoferax sp. TaxID=50421 RepID=UPI001ED57A25|nr:PAS domain S-box protein [Rhodoferax sp.]MBT9505901.1 PAS domain S-box protein [Rhodoferax sp.]